MVPLSSSEGFHRPNKKPPGLRALIQLSGSGPVSHLLRCHYQSSSSSSVISLRFLEKLAWRSCCQRKTTRTSSQVGMAPDPLAPLEVTVLSSSALFFELLTALALVSGISKENLTIKSGINHLTRKEL